MDSTGVGWSAKATQGSGGGGLFCTEQQEEEVIMAVVNVLPHNWPISCKSLVRCKNGARMVHHICWGLQVLCLQVDVFQWWRSDWENGQRRGAGRGMVIDWRPTGSAQTRLISVPQYQIIPNTIFCLKKKMLVQLYVAITMSLCKCLVQCSKVHIIF